MTLPFTVEQFLQVFKNYNLGIWPVQVLLNLVALVGIFLAIRKYEFTDRIIAMLLSFLWFWMGVVYHLIFFTSINKAAYIFGSLFIFQGFLFLWLGVVKTRLTFRFRPNISGIIGSSFMLYALIIYPLLGLWFGHRYPQAPTFGAPCPTTIYTFGLLLWADQKIPKYLLLIPLVWSIIGFSAAMHLSIREDFGLVVAGILGSILIFIKDKNKK